MRRLLTLVLLAAFMLPMAAPLLALAQDPDAGLPVCCRRHGAHHCTMLTGHNGEASPSPHLAAVCPRFPNHSIAPTLRLTSRLESQMSVTAALYVAARAVRDDERSHHHEPADTHPKRGPPVALL